MPHENWFRLFNYITDGHSCLSDIVERVLSSLGWEGNLLVLELLLSVSFLRKNQELVHHFKNFFILNEILNFAYYWPFLPLFNKSLDLRDACLEWLIWKFHYNPNTNINDLCAELFNLRIEILLDSLRLRLEYVFFQLIQFRLRLLSFFFKQLHLVGDSHILHSLSFQNRSVNLCFWTQRKWMIRRFSFCKHCFEVSDFAIVCILVSESCNGFRRGSIWEFSFPGKITDVMFGMS